MRIIKCITDKIKEEIRDAEAYVDLAMKYKEEYPDVADLFYELSEEELGHMEKLHGAVTELINEYRDENGEPPQVMLELWDDQHREQIESTMMVKVKQGMYKA